MPLGKNHPALDDLIGLVDGELDARQAAIVRTHLDSCWLCRSRLAEIEKAISAFVQARAGALEEQIPPADAARAMLRARLTEEATNSFPRDGSTGLMRRWVPWAAAAALVVASFGGLAFYKHRDSDLSVPSRSLTPGETRPVSVNDVCVAQRLDGAPAIPVDLRQKVFRRYGISDPNPDAYEVDYLITPELGGADSVRNLWPEPYSAVWNAHVKDALEKRLHSMVCSGQIDLATAQHELSSDWIGAYRKYFHTDRPDSTVRDR